MERPAVENHRLNAYKSSHSTKNRQNTTSLISWKTLPQIRCLNDKQISICVCVCLGSTQINVASPNSHYTQQCLYQSVTFWATQNHPATKTSLNSHFFGIKKWLSKVRKVAIGFDLSLSHKCIHSRPVDCFSCDAHRIQFFGLDPIFRELIG